MASLSKAQIAALTLRERLDLLAALFKGLGVEPPEQPQWYEKMLEERMREGEAFPEALLVWEEPIAELKKKYERA